MRRGFQSTSLQASESRAKEGSIRKVFSFFGVLTTMVLPIINFYHINHDTLLYWNLDS